MNIKNINVGQFYKLRYETFVEIVEISDKSVKICEYDNTCFDGECCYVGKTSLISFLNRYDGNLLLGSVEYCKKYIKKYYNESTRK